MGRLVGQKTLEKIGRHMWMTPYQTKGKAFFGVHIVLPEKFPLNISFLEYAMVGIDHSGSQYGK